MHKIPSKKKKRLEAVRNRTEETLKYTLIAWSHQGPICDSVVPLVMCTESPAQTLASWQWLS